MIDAPTVRPLAERLSPVLCALCRHPVAHMDQGVTGAKAGGLCTRCTRDRNGKPKAVYTFEVVVDSKP